MAALLVGDGVVLEGCQPVNLLCGTSKLLWPGVGAADDFSI